jgi:putative ABC transport system permease protein
VVFTLTFMAVLNSVFQAQAPSFGRQAGGGYELYLDANPSSGLSAGELSDRPAVAAAAPVLRGQLSGRPEGADPDILWSWNVSGIDPSFLAADPPPLYQRWDGLATDADVWAAITAGEPYLVLDGDLDPAPGDRYVLESADGSQETFTIAGTTEQNWLVGAGLIMASDQAADLFGDARPPTRYYVDLEAGADAEALASELTDSGAEQGIDATTFLAAAKAETDEQETIINLLEGYLALGLLIGIAGLGVVLARAVRERQRQFGIMRALGIAAPVVRRTFVVEAAFVASQGVVLGVGLGLLSSWQVLTRSEAFERDLSFNVPFVPLLVLSIGCLLASLATAAVPAIRAGRVTPAVALRMTT